MTEKEKITKTIVSVLDQSCEQIEPGVRNKIAAARKRAVQEASKGPSRVQQVNVWQTGDRWGAWRGPLAAVAASLALVVVLTGVFKAPSMKIDPEAIAVVEMLSSEENLEFYENIEFYAWLADVAEETAGS